MEKLTKNTSLLSWILAAASVAIGVGWNIGWNKDIPPQIPLFYSKPWGDEQLAKPLWIWAPIGMAVLIAAATSLINKNLKKYPVLQSTITAAALISQVILAAAVIRIIILVM